MKRITSLVLVVLMVLVAFAACTGKKTDEVDLTKDGAGEDGKAEIAMVTDVGQLLDKSFNQGTWEGVVRYATANGKTYKYYQPANGSNASDDDRINAMEQAITNGAKIIVAPGFLQATAMETVAKKHTDVKFVFVDGWALSLDNVTAIVYKEQESGYLAGYAAVMEGYTKLGFTGGGGGTNPAVNRYGYGFLQGAEAAAKEKNVDVTVKYSFLYGSTFSASAELQTQISGWYDKGTEVVFACGGTMFNSVLSAADKYPEAKVIGVDVDQSYESEKVITSAMKGLSVSVQKVLGQFYADKWDAELKNVAQNLGAADDATGLPEATWSLKNFKLDDYKALFAKIKSGEIKPTDVVPDDVTAGWTKLTVDFEK